MKKMTTLLILITIHLNLLAPSAPSIYIAEGEAIRPFEAIWRAVCQVESSGNPLAVGDKHLSEWSYGVAQLRRVRIDDYNRRTGSNYTIKDAFSPEVSKRIFMFYAHQIGPYDTDYLIRKWNGSGEKTYIYLAKVQKVLISL